ncbi:MAG TPA: isochorismatase family protein [Pseudolabrys sp.]|nr:isochorismatase family protein [Pseudolabrys sp.]
MLRLRHLMPLVGLAAAVFYAMPTPASAQTIIDEWSSVKAPPAPALTSVTVDPKTTALLMLDFLKQNCGSNPRCVATLPKAQKLLAAARAKNMTIIYSVFPGPVIGDTLPEVAPKGTEPVVTSFFNKFLDPNLDKVLKDKGIKTVILMGAASDGAVLYTGTEAFFRHYQTIIAVDAIAGATPYVDQFTVYQFTVAPVMAGKIILTRTDMIKF